MGIASSVNAFNAFATSVRARLRAVENRTTNLEANSGSWNYQLLAANKTLVNRDFVMLTAANLQLTLPAAPALGTRVAVRTTDTTAKILRNGLRIESKLEDLPLNLANVTVTLTYMNAAQGWVLT